MEPAPQSAQRQTPSGDEHHPSPRQTRRFFTVFGAVVFVAFVGAVEILSETSPREKPSLWPFLCPGVAIFAGLAIWSGWVRSLRHAAPAVGEDEPADDAENSDPVLTSDLAGVDVPCPNCGYNLRDGRGGVCPECGLRLTRANVFHQPRDVAALPALDMRKWSPPRRRTPAWAVIGAVATAALFVISPLVIVGSVYLHSVHPLAGRAWIAGATAILIGLFASAGVGALPKSARTARWALLVMFAFAVAALIILAFWKGR